jgi:AcrR family transcriptional regulator
MSRPEPIVEVEVEPAFPSAETLQEKIGVAVALLFQARGYEAVTIDDIVAEVGSAKGSRVLGRLFPDCV